MGDTGTDLIFLRPRSLAKCAGSFLLLPLLPPRPLVKPLPTEVWTGILAYVFEEYEDDESLLSCRERSKQRLQLLLISKELKNIVLPLFYARIYINSLQALDGFAALLHSAEQMWDSIRRIPYSTPGRWVRTIDLSSMSCNLWQDEFHVDAVLTQLFPLVPFLLHLALSPNFTLSRRVVSSMTYRDGATNLRFLRGIKISETGPAASELIIGLLRSCPKLEELEVLGLGVDGTDYMPEDTRLPDQFHQLELTYLRNLTLLSIPSSLLMSALLQSPLPSLSRLTLTPYDDVAIPSLVPQFISTHGHKLSSLHLYAPKMWPTSLFPSPPTLLHTCTNLRHLSLEHPLPALSIPSTPHPLKILSVPRPKAEFFPTLERLLPRLPGLRAVRARDVRWLRKGMGLRAQEAGVQGEMREWNLRLTRRGIHVLDTEWRHI